VRIPKQKNPEGNETGRLSLPGADQNSTHTRRKKKHNRTKNSNHRQRIKEREKKTSTIDAMLQTIVQSELGTPKTFAKTQIEEAPEVRNSAEKDQSLGGMQKK